MFNAVGCSSTPYNKKTFIDLGSEIHCFFTMKRDQRFLFELSPGYFTASEKVPCTLIGYIGLHIRTFSNINCY